MQEDLAALFARQMSMVPQQPLCDTQRASYTVPTIAYSVSQHYHHSSHVISKTSAGEATGGTISPSFETSSAHDILIQHNVDPESLSPSQRHLFEHAIPEQRSRLLQIWQICPNKCEMKSNAETVPISRSSQSRTCEGSGYSHQAHTSPEDLTADIEMCGAAQNRSFDDDFQQYAEPYMVSGYGVLASGERGHAINTVAPLMDGNGETSLYRAAKDPVYQFQSQRWWEQTDRESLMDHPYQTWKD